MSAQALSPVDLGLAAVLVLVVGVAGLPLRLGLTRSLLVAAVRCAATPPCCRCAVAPAGRGTTIWKTAGAAG